MFRVGNRCSSIFNCVTFTAKSFIKSHQRKTNNTSAQLKCKRCIFLNHYDIHAYKCKQNSKLHLNEPA